MGQVDAVVQGLEDYEVGRFQVVLEYWVGLPDVGVDHGGTHSDEGDREGKCQVDVEIADEGVEIIEVGGVLHEMDGIDHDGHQEHVPAEQEELVSEECVDLVPEP